MSNGYTWKRIILEVLLVLTFRIEVVHDKVYVQPYGMKLCVIPIYSFVKSIVSRGYATMTYIYADEEEEEEN